MKNYILPLALMVAPQSFAQMATFSNPNFEPGRGIVTIAGKIPLLKSPGCMQNSGVGTTAASQTSLSIRSLKQTSEYISNISNKFGFDVSKVVDKVKVFSANGSHKNIKSAIRKSTTSVGEITVRKEFEYVSLRDPTPSDFLNTLAQSSNPHELYQTCGDSYIHGYKKVVETVGYIICETDSVTKKRNLDNSFDAFGVIRGVNVGVNASRQVDETTSQYSESCQVAFFSRGGGSGSISIDSVGGFLQSAINYTFQSTSDQAWIEDVETIKYSSVLDADLRAVLEVQQIEFPTAESLLSPLAGSVERMIETLLASNGEESDMGPLEDLFEVISDCVDEPWAPSTNCVVSDPDTPPFPF